MSGTSQDLVKQFTSDLKIHLAPHLRIMDLVSEVGEMSKEYLKSTDYGKRPFRKNDDWESEIGQLPHG